MAEQQRFDDENNLDGPLSLLEFSAVVREASNQPPWRVQADEDADYADGNQLDTALLRRMQQLGMPPAKENIIGPAIAAVCGYEAKTRTDWRVTPDGDPAGQDVADALNYKLNQAESRSKADDALSAAFRPAISVGIGWVEVARASNSLQFPYKCRYVHRNEIWWDMNATEDDLSDARWLFRRRWIHKTRAAQLFPEHRWLFERRVDSWLADYGEGILEGAQSTGLRAAANAERAWTTVEDRWYNEDAGTVCITEVWYRRWVPKVMLKMASGRAVEHDSQNELHSAAVMAGRGKLVEELLPQVRMGYWMGPHMLHDGESPYPHEHFPYVPMFGYKEDMTRVPFGLVRDMRFPQDNLNSSISKLRWGMAAVRTERTKGAVAMADDVFRRTISRVDADIVLDQVEMAKPGARFEVKRDFQLNDQQFKLMEDSRNAMERVSGINPAFRGGRGTATSGAQEQTQLEQSQVSLAALMDNFRKAREQVGELLLALIMEDIGKEEQAVVIEGDTLHPARTVVLNKPEVDPLTGMQYRSNDTQRTRLLVALEEVPTTSSFRAQQLQVLGDAVESLPQELQKVALPFMVNLMDLPAKEDLVEAIRQASAAPDPEQLREQIKQELMHDLKERELAMKAEQVAAGTKLDAAKAVQIGVQAAYSAMQAGAQVAQMPMIAPIADEVMAGAGYRRPNPIGDDPDFPTPEQAAARNVRSPYIEGEGAQPGSEQLPEMTVQQNTSPAFPPVPQQPSTGMDGIETARATDNIPA